MAREVAYVNAMKSEVNGSSPLPKRVTCVLAVLAALILLLAILLIAMAALYFQNEATLQQFEGAVQKIRASLRLRNVSHKFPVDTSRHSAPSDIQLLENICEAFSEIQAHLENVSMLQTNFQDDYRNLRELIVAGWTFYNGSLYFLAREAKPWREAEEVCRARGAHLTSVTSKEEMEYLAKEARGQSFWIGLNDQQEEGTWRWVDGTKYDQKLSFWKPRQPDNWAGAPEHQEDCVRVHPDWNDVSCTYSHKGFCKKSLR